MEKLPQPQGDGSDLLRGKAMTTKIAPSLSQHCWLLCENREEIVAKVREDMDSLSGREPCGTEYGHSCGEHDKAPGGYD